MELDEEVYILWKKVRDEVKRLEGWGQRIKIQLGENPMIETEDIPLSQQRQGRFETRQPKSLTRDELESILKGFEDLVTIEEGKDVFLVKPKKYLGNQFDPLNDMLRNAVGVKTWTVEEEGKKKHWRIPKK